VSLFIGREQHESSTRQAACPALSDPIAEDNLVFFVIEHSVLDRTLHIDAEFSTEIEEVEWVVKIQKQTHSGTIWSRHAND